MSSSARKPKPPQSAAQRQRELARLLVRMDEMLKITAEMAVRARARVSVGGLNRYRRFAKRVRDFFALATVAEEKLYSMPELAESPMATALDRLHARMVVMFVEGSAAFFTLYRRVPELPLGAHEICGVELRGLHEIRKFLDDERYDGERGQALRRQADLVMDLMHDVMDRVPPLEDFGDLPSISPKGVSRQPIKVAPKRRPPEPPPPEPDPEPEPVTFPTAPPSWSVMTPDDMAGAGGQPNAWRQDPHYPDGGHPPGQWIENDEYDDSAYLEDAPDDVADDNRPSAVPSSRGEPSPLVRELTLDMVEAEERRAAMAERLAASGRGAPPPPSAPASAPPSAPPAAAPSAPAGPRPAAPFRAPRPAGR